MLSQAQREALVRADLAARSGVLDVVHGYARAVWVGLGSWRDADVDRFVSQVVPTVRAGQAAVARTTDTWLGLATGDGPAGLVDLHRGLRTADTAEAYRRPAVQMRYDLSRGQTLQAALAASLVRLASLVATDLQLANVHQARRSLASWQGGYRRTLSGASACALCVIASTQRYRRAELMPIHPGCSCGVEPLRPGGPDGQVLDAATLERLHRQVEAATGGHDRSGRDLGLGTGKDYRELVVTHQHGDIGPVLGWRRQAFTSAADLAA
ncbi:MAG: hypothetical protein FWH11_01280 [Micrococcales bacterium]|nr:hypothetical protein [Micrococcales bacterium]